MKRITFIGLVTIATFVIGFFAFRFFGKWHSWDRPPEMPIAFQPSEKHKTPCTATYYGMGDGDGVYDPRCSALQIELITASRNGDVEQIKRLLQMGANANANADNCDKPLQEAARNGHIEAARILIDNGANVNYYDGLRGTPLLNAIYGSHDVEMIKFLLARGADPTPECDGGTALVAATKRNYQEIVSLLIQAGAKK